MVKDTVEYESHRCTVHFVKSLQLLTNKCTYITFILKHSDMFRSFQIIIREFRRSFLKLLHIDDLVRFCKQGLQWLIVEVILRNARCNDEIHKSRCCLTSYLPDTVYLKLICNRSIYSRQYNGLDVSGHKQNGVISLSRIKCVV